MHPTASKRFLSQLIQTGALLCVASLPLNLATAAETVAAAPAAPEKAKAALPAGISFVRTVEGIDEYQLPNGLHVLLVPDASKPTTTVNITYRVGSRYENYGETGMAHLLEHLMFKGSKAHPRLWEEMSQHGVQFNGTTWLDRTNYYETFAANPGTLSWALSMEADRMVNSRISGDDLKTEMTVVRNEMEMDENNPVRILLQRTTSAAYQWHNYGHDTIGARSDVENVNIPHLQAFWRKYYQPDNSVLLVAGAFDPATTLAQIARDFGKIPRPKRSIDPTYTLDPTQDGEKEVTVRRVGDSQFVIALYHTVPASHPDFAAVEALSLILADPANGRLYKALVEDKKAVSVFPWVASMEEPGFMVVGANLQKEQDLAAAKKILTETVEGIAQHPITEAELAHAKDSLNTDLTQTFNDPERFGVALSENIAAGDWRLFFLTRDRIDALKVADVQRVALAWLKASNRTVGSFIPEAKPDRVPAPAKVDVAAQIAQFKPGVALTQAENFVASPDNIDKRTQTGTLTNGMRYALLAKTTRGQTVTFNLTLNFGSEQSLKGRSTAAEMTANLLNRGTAKLSYQQFQEELQHLKATLTISGDALSATVAGQTTRANLPRVLELVHDALRTPAFSENEFNNIVQLQLTELAEARKEPQEVARDDARKKFFTLPIDDPRAHRSFDEKIALLKALKLEDVKAFWSDFYGTGHAQLAVIGDFDANAVKTQLQTEFGDWTAKQAYQRTPNLSFATAPERLTAPTPDKANAMFYGIYGLKLGDKDPDYPALALGTYLLGGSANSRILQRIRQKDGVSYGGGCGLWVSDTDEAGYLVVGAIFAPQNRAKLETGLKEEIERASKEGFGTAEIEDGKKSYLQQLQLQRSQDGDLSHTLARNLYTGRSMQDQAELEKKVQALTPAQVNAVMQKYVSFDRLISVAAGDFK